MNNRPEARPLPASTVSRRRFLESAAVTAAGLTQASIACASATRQGSRQVVQLPSRPARSAIVLFLCGGVSHIDTFDPRPDAPREFRGECRAISTSLPGLAVSELFPRIAQRADRLAFLRSMHHDSAPVHEAGQQLMRSGVYTPDGPAAPTFGAVIAQLCGRSNAGLENVELTASASGLPGALPDDRRYGPGALGRACLAARRLIEQRPHVCTINHCPNLIGAPSWDMHANGALLATSISDYRTLLAPQLDRALSALMDDLHERGLLGQTVVAVVSEMGRSPRVNDRGGRGHWTGAWTCLLAGGPVCPGAVVGATDRLGSTPIDRPVTPAALLSTLYLAMGIATHRAEAVVAPGRPRSDGAGAPVAELFG